MHARRDRGIDRVSPKLHAQSFMFNAFDKIERSMDSKAKCTLPVASCSKDPEETGSVRIDEETGGVRVDEETGAVHVDEGSAIGEETGVTQKTGAEEETGVDGGTVTSTASHCRGKRGRFAKSYVADRIKSFQKTCAGAKRFHSYDQVERPE